MFVRIDGMEICFNQVSSRKGRSRAEKRCYRRADRISLRYRAFLLSAKAIRESPVVVRVIIISQTMIPTDESRDLAPISSISDRFRTKI